MSPTSLTQNPNSPIPIESFSKAIDALLKWIKSQPKHQKSQLFEPDDILYLILTLARVPVTGRTNPYRIPIPHPLHPFDPQFTSICLFLDDRPNSALPPSTALEQIRTRNLPISFAIGLSDLKSDYQPYESRRKLCDSYDLFFADRSIVPLLPRLLGKHFFKRKKIPLAVDFSRIGWVEQIKAWCESSLLYLRMGTCCGLKIGRVGMGKDEILENAVVVLEKAMEIVPRKWGNLRSVHVKTVESVALPVYQKLPEIGLRIKGPEDEKAVILKKGKKRVRGGEEKGRKRVRGSEEKEKKTKKGRIHDSGCIAREENVGGDGEVVSAEVCVETKAKKENFKKRTLEGREERDELVVKDADMNGVEQEVHADELELKGNKKKKKKENKGGKVKEAGGDGVELGCEEQSEFSGKKLKKKKKTIENVVVPSEEMKTCKPKKKGDKSKEEVSNILRMKGMKKKVKKGGNANENVGKENGGSDLSEKNKEEVEEDAVVASDGKKSRRKKAKENVAKKSKRGKVSTGTD